MSNQAARGGPMLPQHLHDGCIADQSLQLPDVVDVGVAR
jgi:hypothetical protein